MYNEHCTVYIYAFERTLQTVKKSMFDAHELVK